MKKIFNIAINLILVLSMIFVFTACDKKEKAGKSTGVTVYYLDESKSSLLTEKYEPKSDNVNELIFELFDCLSSNGKKEGHISPIPKEVIVNGFNLADGMITVDFNEAYKSMDNQSEVLCRAAVVLTLTQIATVEYISFTVEDVPYQKDEAAPLGAMDASSFVDALGKANLYAKSDFILYFGNASGEKLKEYKLEGANYSGHTKEEFVMEKLIEGPDKKEYTATMSENVTLNNIVTANNICYVDLSEEFLLEQSNVANELVIYSIVNSLSELNDIHRVQISVNGKAEIEYHDDISLESPLIRKLDLVE